MPDAGEGSQETGTQLSRVLPEASGGATVRYRKLDQMGPWPDPAAHFSCSCVLLSMAYRIGSILHLSMKTKFVSFPFSFDKMSLHFIVFSDSFLFIIEFHGINQNEPHQRFASLTNEKLRCRKLQGLLIPKLALPRRSEIQLLEGSLPGFQGWSKIPSLLS